MDQNTYPTKNPEHIPSVNVPPPPAEVTVRTMASDIASIAESGGGAPKPKPIKIPSRIQQMEEAARLSGNIPQVGGVSPPRGKSFFSSPIFLPFLLIVFLAGVFLASYYIIYPVFNPKPQVAKFPEAPVQNQIESFEHKSVFGQQLDGTFILDVTSPISGLAADNEKINSFVSGLSGSFFEITPKNENGQALSAADFFSSIGGNVIDMNFLTGNFEKDFTFFVYKDGNNLRPGYVLRLNAGETPILLQSEVSKIEKASSSWANLFLVSPGAPNSQFQNGLSNSQPIRFLNFSNASSAFAYGWFFNKYLILSTSLEGIRRAILHF